MTTRLQALDIPDDPAELAPWLDRVLVGLDLGDLVQELSAIHPATADEPDADLDRLLDDRLPDILVFGLSSLPRPALSSLLRHPLALLDLQETVLERGGDHWRKLLQADPSLSRSVASTWTSLSPRLHQPPAQRSSPPTILPFVPPPPTPARPPGRYLLKAWSTLATIAASVLGFVYVAEHLAYGPSNTLKVAADASETWGWNRPAVLHQREPLEDHLNHLADAADEWFDDRPVDPDALARRLGQLRTGCSRLILAKNDSLPPADRAWLVDHCRAWAGKLDDAVRSLERGDPPERVRDQADAVVHHLIDVLRKRSGVDV